VEKQNSPQNRSFGGYLVPFFRLGSRGVDAVGGGVERRFDAAAQQSQDGDDDKRDERDEQAILDEGLALFFLQ